MIPRVAVVFSQLTLGGSERQTLELLRRVRGTVWAPVLVACLSEDVHPYGAAVSELGYAFEVLPRTGNFELRRLQSLRRVLTAHDIQVVHAVGLLASAYAWLAALGASRMNVLPSMRGGVVPPQRLRRLLYALMLRSTRVTLVNSHEAAAYLSTNFHLPPGKVAVVPNGVDILALHEARLKGGFRDELGLSPDEPVIGFIGKDAPVKNLPLFLDAFRRLLSVGDSAHAVVVGQRLGDDARQRYACDIPASRVHFLGPRNDVPALLREMDVLVLTSLSEGCPNVVLEAIAVGTPVVASAVGDIPRILRNSGAGTVVEPQDADAFARAIADLLRAEPRANGERGRQLGWLSANYSVDAMVERTVALWEAARPAA
jgi:starch synthase (maltosyl-transferring)